MTFKIIHILGLVLLTSSIIILLLTKIFKNSVLPSVQSQFQKLGFALHGSSLIILIITGLGMAGKLGWLSSPPNWFYLKILVWFVLGLFVSLIKRTQLKFRNYFLLYLALVSIASYLAVMKPF